MPSKPRPRAATRKPELAELAGEVLALRVIVRRLVAHVAAIEGGDLGYLRQELKTVLAELPQYNPETLTPGERTAAYARARQVILEAYKTISIDGDSLDAS